MTARSAKNLGTLIGSVTGSLLVNFDLVVVWHAKGDDIQFSVFPPGADEEDDADPAHAGQVSKAEVDGMNKDQLFVLVAHILEMVENDIAEHVAVGGDPN
jgi:hypothetical protein